MRNEYQKRERQNVDGGKIISPCLNRGMEIYPAYNYSKTIADETSRKFIFDVKATAEKKRLIRRSSRWVRL